MLLTSFAGENSTTKNNLKQLQKILIMNFQEYVNQKDPQRQAPLSVKVTREEIKQTGHFAEFKGMNLEIVQLLGFNYILINNKGSLYTMNENGQPKEQSVFYLIN